jgi:protein-disulfide isomerase
MDHHEHPHHPHQPNKENIIAISIIIGALLVCISVFYNTRLLIKSGLGGGGNLQVQDGSGAQVAALPDTAPVKVDERKGAALLGKSSAKVEIVEFSDFQCPFCQKFFNETYKQIKTKYIDTGKVKLVFRHFPLSNIHPFAQKAGEASECALKQNKFFEYHDVLFQKGQADGTGLSVQDLKQYAKDLGLNQNNFNSCLDSGQMADVVKNDATTGSKAGVTGTPTLFVNGVKIVGAQPYSVFEQAIENALK